MQAAYFGSWRDPAAELPDDADAEADPVRELRAFRWGFCPSGQRI
jgi:hypothetical protein